MHPLLVKEIQHYTRNGYRIVHQTDTTAQLVKPKQFSCLLATIATLLFGIGLIFYLFYYMAEKDKVIYLQVVDNKIVRTYG